MQEQRCIFYRH